MLICSAHAVIDGWISRIVGWIENKLDELSRYAADPTSGGGLQSVDYFVLQLLNRQIPTLKHLQGSRFVHPERLYDELLRLAGELATFATPERRARNYPQYDHDDLENVFEPLVRDIQDFLSARLGRRAIRLELIERAQNAFVSPIRDRTLFRNATLVLEVAATSAADRDSEPIPTSFQGWPQYQDERDRPRASSRRAARTPANAAVPNPRDHGSRLFLSGPEVTAMAGFQYGGLDWDALLGRLARP